MPYIITIKTEQHIGYSLTERTTRRVVATLDEARQAIWLTQGQHLKGAERRQFSNAVFGQPRIPAIITESGGTIGPLPDGTVIEVERA